MSMTRLPLTWAFFVTAILLVWFLSCIICSAVIDFDRSFGTSFFRLIFILLVKCYIIKVDSVLFEHLFWF
jgi:heme/copper-type cytochrome/quinol oxidase subunit 1